MYIGIGTLILIVILILLRSIRGSGAALLDTD